MYITITGRRLLSGVLTLAILLLGAVGMTLTGAAPAAQASAGNWGLSFPRPGEPPVANATGDSLRQYNAWYLGDTGQKRLYITFDAGYENGCTAPILDALKKHNAPAAFFVVGHYLESAPELVRRMADEGHIVANHTYSHPDMSALGDKDSFLDELTRVEQKYKEVTGRDMPKIYRPPQGKYSEQNLKMAHDAGYHTFFWSLAYVDWYVDRQPTHQQAYDKLLGRVHPGAVVLLHSTSATNAQILDELLTKWEEMGYSFGLLTELCGG